MSSQRKFKLPGDMVRSRLERGLMQQQQVNQWLRQSLHNLPRVLNQVGAVTLADQQGALLDAKVAIEKALKLGRDSQVAVNAAAGHAAEGVSVLNRETGMNGPEQEPGSGHILRGVATHIINEDEWFAGYPQATAAVIEVAEPDTLSAAIAMSEAAVQSKLALAVLANVPPEIIRTAFAAQSTERQAEIANLGE